MPAAHFLGLRPRLVFAQYPDDLLLAEATPFHRPSPFSGDGLYLISAEFSGCRPILKVNHQERPSNLKNTGGKTALERLCDRESLRTLSLVQGMIFEELCQSETRHLETIWRNYALRKLICYY